MKPEKHQPDPAGWIPTASEVKEKNRVRNRKQICDITSRQRHCRPHDDAQRVSCSGFILKPYGENSKTKINHMITTLINTSDGNKTSGITRRSTEVSADYFYFSVSETSQPMTEQENKYQPISSRRLYQPITAGRYTLKLTEAGCDVTALTEAVTGATAEIRPLTNQSRASEHPAEERYVYKTASRCRDAMIVVLCV